ncbi:biofilm development regulator YmgB/AriR family protein [Yokenella regensburgei]|uniref:biofilm development regulator YmgB/AriR family protein n=1 Tax=Yokenella regensburgei TaxID=158877 RepID=UPI003F5CC12B
MFDPSEQYENLPANALTDYFKNAGEVLAEEAAILGGVIRSILAYEGQITNKAIILRLINLLENTEDVVTGDIIRKTLEIVVDHTLDDI